MLSINARIERTQRLLRLLDQDAPLLEVRVAPLTAEHRQSTLTYADLLRAKARAELEKLLQERHSDEALESTPQPAD
jgi:hypothetical protein